LHEFIQNTKITFEREMNERSSIGTISEIYDSKAPFESRGAFAQAWSVAEVFRIILNKY
jgi:glycogen debranching enzyme